MKKKKNDLCGRVFPKFAFLIVSHRYRNSGGGRRAGRARVCMCAHKTTISRRLRFGRPRRAVSFPIPLPGPSVSRINRLIGLRAHNKKTISPRCFVAGARTRERKKNKTKIFQPCARARVCGTVVTAESVRTAHYRFYGYTSDGTRMVQLNRFRLCSRKRYGLT